MFPDQIKVKERSLARHSLASNRRRQGPMNDSGADMCIQDACERLTSRLVLHSLQKVRQLELVETFLCSMGVDTETCEARPWNHIAMQPPHARW
jgi:hypothetical protein